MFTYIKHKYEAGQLNYRTKRSSHNEYIKRALLDWAKKVTFLSPFLGMHVRNCESSDKL